MPVQHKDIPESELHEPKGASTASVNTVYKSNGAGSGTWSKVGTDSLKGLTGDGGQVNYKVVTDGSNGFKIIKDIAYVQMGISGNTNSFTVATATDATLNTNADYVQLASTGAPWTGGLGQDASFSTNQLLVGVPGVYEVSLVATVIYFPTSTAKVAFKVRINGATYLPRKAIMQAQIAGMTIQGSMVELVTLSANDVLQVAIASSAAGGVVVGDMSVVAKLIKAT